MGPGEQELDKIQRIAARVVATNAAGHKLLLIGGFRYRLLDRSSGSHGTLIIIGRESWRRSSMNYWRFRGEF